MNGVLENWVTVAECSAIAPGTVIGLKAGELDVAIYNIEGQYYATHNICTHAHARLSDGWLEVNVRSTVAGLRSRVERALVRRLSAISRSCRFESKAMQSRSMSADAFSPSALRRR